MRCGHGRATLSNACRLSSRTWFAMMRFCSARASRRRVRLSAGAKSQRSGRQGSSAYSDWPTDYMALDRKTIFFVKLGFGIAAFALAVYVLDWRHIWDAAGQLTVAAMLVVLLVILSEFPFLAWRWHVIVREESSAPAQYHVECYF